MIKKHCVECPWVVKSQNNKTIKDHARTHCKQHNCHMVPIDKAGGLWDVKEAYICIGAKNNIKTETDE